MIFWTGVLLVGICLCLNCDAVIEIRGSLIPDDTTKVEIKCFFSVGAVYGYSIEHERRLYRTSSDIYSDLSFTSKSGTNNLCPSAGSTEVVGSLTEGVTFILHQASCFDAGVYKCTFIFDSFHQTYKTKNHSSEERTLELLPSTIRILSYPSAINFRELKDQQIKLTLNCSTRTTLQVQWFWEFRPRRFIDEWTQFPVNYSVSSTPLPNERCFIMSRSSLTVFVNKYDLGKQFRCYVVYNNQYSEPAVFRLKDYNTLKPFTISTNFQTILTTAGWLTLTLILLLIITLVFHSMFPGALQTSVRNFRRSLRHRHHPNQAQHQPGLQLEAGVHGEPGSNIGTSGTDLDQSRSGQPHLVPSALRDVGEDLKEISLPNFEDSPGAEGSRSESRHSTIPLVNDKQSSDALENCVNSENPASNEAAKRHPDTSTQSNREQRVQDAESAPSSTQASATILTGIRKITADRK